MRSAAPYLVPLVAGGVLAACHLVSGVGDLQFADPGPNVGGATTTTTTSTGGQAGGTTTTTTSTTTSTTTGTGGGGGSAGSGGAGGGGGWLPCEIALQDSFDAPPVDAAKWTESVTGCMAGVSGGHYQIGPTPSAANAWASLTSVESYDLTDCAVFLEIVELLSEEGSNRATIYISAAGDHVDSAGFAISGGQIVSRVLVGGNETALDTRPYNASAYRWLRLRESGGTLYFEASANTDAWEVLAETEAPAYTSAAYFRLGAGNWAGDSATPGRARFDRVNVWP